ncbi:MAG: OB-fold nucleic acid binding domain-containing protein, partial [Chloroflexi bacterium]|nr:OB-fold nucleic acid binding domain-containing protein [Chloroflexota bacterium]
GVHFLNPCVNRSEVRAAPEVLSPRSARGDAAAYSSLSPRAAGVDAAANPFISPRAAGGDAEGRGGLSDVRSRSSLTAPRVRESPLCHSVTSPPAERGERERGELSARLGLGMIKDIGPESARVIVAEREARGPYADAGELVRRTGVKPQAVRSLIEAGAFDAVTPNRREALWEAGLSIRPARSGQRAFPVHGAEAPPRFDDFTDYEKMVGEYKTLGIYPSGHVMEFIRPTLDAGVLTTAQVYDCADGERIRVAGWPIARQHPRGQDGTVFVTIEDETGDVQSIVWPKVFARCRRALSNQLILLQGRIDRWDGTTNIVAERIDAIGAGIRMPSAHDWH